MAAEPPPTSSPSSLPDPSPADPPALPPAADPLAFRRILAGALLGSSLAGLLLAFPYPFQEGGPRGAWEVSFDATAVFFSSLAFGACAVALAMLHSAERRFRTVETDASLWKDVSRLFRVREPFFVRLRTDPSDLNSPEEWAAAGGCLSLFETCGALLGDGLVDPRRFRRVYAARLREFAYHPGVRARLFKEDLPYVHPDFVALCRLCDVPWRESPSAADRASSQEEDPSR